MLKKIKSRFGVEHWELGWKIAILPKQNPHLRRQFCMKTSQTTSKRCTTSLGTKLKHTYLRFIRRYVERSGKYHGENFRGFQVSSFQGTCWLRGIPRSRGAAQPMSASEIQMTSHGGFHTARSFENHQGWPRITQVCFQTRGRGSRL